MLFKILYNFSKVPGWPIGQLVEVTQLFVEFKNKFRLQDLHFVESFPIVQLPKEQVESQFIQTLFISGTLLIIKK